MNSQPASPSPYVPLRVTRTGKRPGWLIAVCVITIVLGSLGILTATQRMLNLLVQSQSQTMQMRMQTMFMPPGPNVRKMQELQQEMLQSVEPIVRRWLPFSVTLIVLKILECAGLLAGAIMTLGYKPAGRVMLLVMLLASIPIDLLDSVIMSVMQSQVMDVVAGYMPRMMEASTPPGAPMPPGMKEVMSMAMKFAAVFSLVIAFGWLALKFGFYIPAALYLRRPGIRGLFAGPMSPKPLPAAMPPA